MSQYEPLYDSFSHGGHGGYVPTPRMSVSASVYLPGSDVDPQTGWLKPDRQRRCRTQGKKLEMERLTREQQALEESIRREMSKGGVRISVRMGVFLTALLLFICGLCVRFSRAPSPTAKGHQPSGTLHRGLPQPERRPGNTDCGGFYRGCDLLRCRPVTST